MPIKTRLSTNINQISFHCVTVTMLPVSGCPIPTSIRIVHIFVAKALTDDDDKCNFFKWADETTKRKRIKVVKAKRTAGKVGKVEQTAIKKTKRAKTIVSSDDEQKQGQN